MFLPHPRVKVSIVGSLRDRKVACSASDRQGSNFKSCVWRTVSSQSSHHPQEVILAQFSLYVHKSGLKPDSFHFMVLYIVLNILRMYWKKRSFISLPKLVKQFFSLHKQSRPVVGKLWPVIAFKVLDCQILPILEYASDIWYTGDSVNDLEKIHLKFIKSTLGARKQTPTPVIYGNTGRFPLIIRRHIKAVKYWCRILDLPQNRPVRNAYNVLLELDGTGFTNWCSRIRSVLELTGLYQAWETQHIDNTKKFMRSLKDSIVRIFTQRWWQDIESSSKLRTYSLVKKYLCVEPYILNIKWNHHITAMTRYRMSSHDLKIERGRYNNPITPIIQ